MLCPNLSTQGLSHRIVYPTESSISAVWGLSVNVGGLGQGIPKLRGSIKSYISIGMLCPYEWNWCFLKKFDRLTARGRIKKGQRERSAKGKRAKEPRRESSPHYADNPKTEVVVSITRVVVDTKGRPTKLSIGEPRTAAKQAITIIIIINV